MSYKYKYKTQTYQTHAVESVVDCFVGQPKSTGVNYRIDPGVEKRDGNGPYQTGFDYDDEGGFRNADITLSENELLRNIQQVQSRQNLPVSQSLFDFHEYNPKKDVYKSVKPQYIKQAKAICDTHLDIEMETGTGKTYCYIKTIFEMNQRYGWSKFIIVVPSIAIREGVFKSLGDTADHFLDNYGKRAKYFIYDSKKGLHDIESFSSDSGINIMVINIQAFNASGKDNRRIYEEIDDFQSRRPIDVISANRPILILDEPQKMEGAKTIESFAKFKPLMVLRYSATHRTSHNKIHRLDAVDAYNQKLVKKIGVRGISVKGLAGTNGYLYLEHIEISKKAPVASIEFEVKQKSGIKKVTRKLGKGHNLYELSNGLEQYKNGYIIAQIDAIHDTVEFTNGVILSVGDATGDVSEEAIRRIQIRETIKAHLAKERQLFAQNIKVLSLFFIDEVAKYRDYEADDTKGIYARMFEEEYAHQVQNILDDLLVEEDYREYLSKITADQTHNGYFSVDKKGRMVDTIKKAKSEQVESTDVDAYDLILKDKEALLTFPTANDSEELRARRNTRFIFSHSALREGWDNPNIFVMCMLKHSDNTISRRQEVGRGLRISVNAKGERQDQPSTVHQINELSVIASESYDAFVRKLQGEIAEGLSARPRKADKEYFMGKVIETEDGELKITEVMANQIYRYLLKNDFTDDKDAITDHYHQAKSEGKLPELPEELEPYRESVFALIDGVFSTSQIPDITNDRKPKLNPLNSNFRKKEFQELWAKINKRAVYKVDFDSQELIKKCISAINKDLRITKLSYQIEAGELRTGITDEDLISGDGFQVREKYDDISDGGAYSTVSYDLIGKISESTVLTRKTVASILSGIEDYKFNFFQQNPEQFIAEASRLINEQKAGVIINKLTYDETDQTFDSDIFTASQSKQDFTKATEPLKRHIYDYVITDSKVEKEFVRNLDVSEEVVVYAKLPKGFFIPTPVEDYNPDWAISFKEGAVKHIYFIAETKGSMESLQLRAIEEIKIDCAKKFFEKISGVKSGEQVKYGVITNYDQLMTAVKS